MLKFLIMLRLRLLQYVCIKYGKQFQLRFIFAQHSDELFKRHNYILLV